MPSATDAAPTLAELPPVRVALDAVRAHEQAMRTHELATITAVLDWVVLCQARDLDAATHIGDAGELGPFAALAREEGLTIAGPGAPLVGESMLAELCVALGRSPASGRAWVGAVLEVRYRLPRLWAAVSSGRCPFWRARRVAERTIALCEDGAGFVDAHVDGFAHAVSLAQLDRIVETALVRWQPEVAEERRRAAAEGRGVEVHLSDAGTQGTVQLSGCLDVADALDLEARLTHEAHEMARLGSPEPLGVRRCQALGALARTQETLPQATDDRPSPEPRPAGTVPRRVVLVVHLSRDALRADTGTEGCVGRLENLRIPVLAEQVRDWCGSATAVAVRPVVDLADDLSATAYETPTRIREQVETRDSHCVFPPLHPSGGALRPRPRDGLAARRHDLAQPGPPVPAPPPPQDPPRLDLRGPVTRDLPVDQPPRPADAALTRRHPRPHAATPDRAAGRPGVPTSLLTCPSADDTPRASRGGGAGGR